MLKYLIALAGLVALAAGECSQLDRLLVKQQWAEAYGVGHERLDFGTAIWRAIFNAEPLARDLFDRVNGDDLHSDAFQAHSSRVLGGLDLCISVLDDPDVLAAQLAHLRTQHDERGIPHNYFQIMGQALMQILPAQLGHCFHEQAWEDCYAIIANGISGAE